MSGTSFNPPRNLRCTAVTVDNISLTWDPDGPLTPPGWVVRYRVYNLEKNNAWTPLIPSSQGLNILNQSFITIENLGPVATTFEFDVQATDGTNVSSSLLPFGTLVVTLLAG